MTRESAGFFARLFGKRSAAGQTVTPEIAEVPTKEAKAVPPTVQDVVDSSTQKPASDEAVHTGKHVKDADIENSDIDNAGSQHSEAAVIPEQNPDTGTTREANAGVRSVEDDRVESAEKTEKTPPSRTKVVTVLSLAPHAGQETLCAALADRFEDQDITVRSAGPGLMRAAFAGALSGSDALVLVAPADPEITSEFAEKLSWLEANGRIKLAGQSIFVVNYGAAGEDRALALPADLERPVVMLPFDNALSLPTNVRRAPRRAARHAISQIIDELNLILNAA